MGQPRGVEKLPIAIHKYIKIRLQGEIDIPSTANQHAAVCVEREERQVQIHLLVTRAIEDITIRLSDGRGIGKCCLSIFSSPILTSSLPSGV